jgi:hypothetical protein
MIQKDPPDHNRTRSGRILISGFWSIAIDRYCAYFNRSAATAVFCSTDILLGSMIFAVPTIST